MVKINDALNRTIINGIVTIKNMGCFCKAQIDKVAKDHPWGLHPQTPVEKSIASPLKTKHDAMNFCRTNPITHSIIPYFSRKRNPVKSCY